MRAVANQLLQLLLPDSSSPLLASSTRPDVEVVKSVIRLAWASSSGNYQLLNASWDDLASMPLIAGTVQYQENEYCEDMQLCK